MIYYFERKLQQLNYYASICPSGKMYKFARTAYTCVYVCMYVRMCVCVCMCVCMCNA